MPKAKKNMSAAEKAAARVPQLSPEEKRARKEARYAELKANDEASRQAMLERRRNPRERARRAAVLVGALLLVCVLGFTLWTCNYAHETDQAREALASTEEVPVDNQPGWIAFGDPSTETGFVLYPGGKVAAESYAPLMRELADAGLFCVIAKVPLNLAFLDNGAIEPVMRAYPEVGNWVLGGHSLGGVAASQWAASHAGELDGLVLLASYPADDLSATGLPVLLVRGTEDGVMTLEAYEEAKRLRPDGFGEVVIEGGNHAQFGDYGEQAGDGAAAIDAAGQQEQTVQAILSWLAE